MIHTAKYSSPIGEMLLAANNTALTGLWLAGQKYFPDSLYKDGENENKILTSAKKWLDRYFAGKAPSPYDLCLAPEGSEFRRQVWKLLLEIPYGHVTTYGALAKALAEKQGVKTMSAQAVGGAVGHNPISVIIPCHRVVGADGSLTGYAGGLDKKLALLTLENSSAAELLKSSRYLSAGYLLS